MKLSLHSAAILGHMESVHIITTRDGFSVLQAVKRFMKLECKCHGVSGSCTLRTCWLAMSDFRKTGDYLRKKYNGAIEVTMNQDGTGFTVANKDFRKATKNDLVYFETSPDYCLMDKAAGKNEKKNKDTTLTTDIIG